MRHTLYIALLLFVAPFFVIQAQDANKFVGAETCGMCHKSEKQGKQLDIWKQSKHSQAYETLKTEKADKIAKEQGFDTPAVKTEKCLKCHTAGYGLDASMFEKKFNVEDGVQCENCHGAGSEYKSLKIMKNRDDAVAKGLMMYDKVEELCVKCHNSDSPTYNKDQDLKAMWETIKHPMPKK
jgi:hypothetical protein